VELYLARVQGREHEGAASEAEVEQARKESARSNPDHLKLPGARTTTRSPGAAAHAMHQLLPRGRALGPSGSARARAGENFDSALSLVGAPGLSRNSWERPPLRSGPLCLESACKLMEAAYRCPPTPPPPFPPAG
jgi:hypothetical protein